MTSQASTEAGDPKSTNLDLLSVEELMTMMQVADRAAIAAVEAEQEAISKAIHRIADRMSVGGKLFYQGAGTSGRIGVLDASECPPTFHTYPEQVQGVIAGGDYALRFAIEGAEDDREQGRVDLERRGFSSKDTLVGIAASGQTPYVLGGLAYARELGAFTVGLSCSAGSEVERAADLAITPQTGPEMLAGSTRLKAGTATKLVLNMLSTGVMVRTGHVYGNLMVNVQPTNRKLRDRACRIVVELTGVTEERAAKLLAETGSVRTAVVMEKLKIDRLSAERRLSEAGGRLRGVIG